MVRVSGISRKQFNEQKPGSFTKRELAIKSIAVTGFMNGFRIIFVKQGEIMYQLDLKCPIGLVIGNEGEGVSRLVKEKCDFTAAIPMKGDIDSLNASVAAGVLAYEIVRQRML